MSDLVDQMELAPAGPVPSEVRRRPRRAQPKMPDMRRNAILVAAAAAVALWGAWVTKQSLAGNDLPPMARVQLSSIVGEYVQAQARSATPPERVAAETKQFMGVVEKVLKDRADQGQILLVSEAVVSSNVPDVTDDVRKAVYSQVALPKVAQTSQRSVLASMQQYMAPAGQASSEAAPQISMQDGSVPGVR